MEDYDQMCRLTRLGFPPLLRFPDRQFDSMVAGRVLLLCHSHFPHVIWQHCNNSYRDPFCEFTHFGEVETY